MRPGCSPWQADAATSASRPKSLHRVTAIPKWDGHRTCTTLLRVGRSCGYGVRDALTIKLVELQSTVKADQAVDCADWFYCPQRRSLDATLLVTVLIIHHRSRSSRPADRTFVLSPADSPMTVGRVLRCIELTSGCSRSTARQRYVASLRSLAAEHSSGS